MYTVPYSRYWMHKARKYLVFATLPLSDAPAWGNPLEFQDETDPTKTKRDGATVWWKLYNPKINHFWLIHPCDRRPDGRVTAYSAALCIYADI